MADDPRLDLSQAALVRYLGHETAQQTREPAQAKGLPPGWWAAVIGAQLADALTTNAALRRGGVEANPVMRGLTGNPTAHLLTKLGIGTGLAGLAHVIHRKSPKAGKVFAGASTVLPATQAVLNTRVNRE